MKFVVLMLRQLEHKPIKPKTLKRWMTTSQSMGNMGGTTMIMLYTDLNLGPKDAEG